MAQRTGRGGGGGDDVDVGAAAAASASAAAAAASAPPQLVFVVEDDEDSSRADRYYDNDTSTRALRSACFTLTLGVMGSAVLPLPFAISRTGLLLGAVTMAVVAWTNAATR